MKYFNGQIDLKWALIYGTVICMNNLINFVMQHPYFYSVIRHGMQVRIAINGLIYRKVIMCFHDIIFKINI